MRCEHEFGMGRLNNFSHCKGCSQALLHPGNGKVEKNLWLAYSGLWVCFILSLTSCSNILLMFYINLHFECHTDM